MEVLPGGGGGGSRRPAVSGLLEALQQPSFVPGLI